MTAAVLAGLALMSIVTVMILLRSLGPGYRVGRLLAATPLVTIEDAAELARGESARYVRVNGRISSAEEFPDEHDRPLVYRRSRIALRDATGRWTTHIEDLEAVPFGVESRSSLIAVDDAALGDGLVVIPREAEGIASDLPQDRIEALPPSYRPTDPARLTIEQLSAVEHATVCGQPVQGSSGPMLTAGLGRPLIVTTLDAPSAMRLLARHHRRRVLAATVLLVASLAFGAAAVVALIVGA